MLISSFLSFDLSVSAPQKTSGLQFDAALAHWNFNIHFAACCGPYKQILTRAARLASQKSSGHALRGKISSSILKQLHLTNFHFTLHPHSLLFLKSVILPSLPNQSGNRSGSPSSKARFACWLAATEATFFSPKPGVSAPTVRAPSQPRQQTQVAPVPAPAAPVAKWYSRTPAAGGGGTRLQHVTREADDNGDSPRQAQAEDSSEEEEECGEEEDGEEGVGMTPGSEHDGSPGEAPSTGGSASSDSPYSDMAVTNCLKSLSRLRFGGGNDDMQVR